MEQTSSTDICHSQWREKKKYFSTKIHIFILMSLFFYESPYFERKCAYFYTKVHIFIRFFHTYPWHITKSFWICDINYLFFQLFVENIFKRRSGHASRDPWKLGGRSQSHSLCARFMGGQVPGMISVTSRFLLYKILTWQKVRYLTPPPINAYTIKNIFVTSNLIFNGLRNKIFHLRKFLSHQIWILMGYERIYFL